jgi:tRNA pseudouridine55 synthase
MASGLLPLAFGEATKFSQMLLDADKVYQAEVKLGIRTDTGDAEGKVISSQPVAIDEAQLCEVLTRFTGDIEQTPPMYSALKHGGKPLYEYARAGIEIERAPRPVSITELSLLAFQKDHFILRIVCSKGTYVRSLAMDIGEALGCGAHLDALRRVRIGDFDLSGSVSLEALEALDPAQRNALLAPPDILLRHFPKLELEYDDARLILQGQPLHPATQSGEKPNAVSVIRIEATQKPGNCVRLYGPNGFLGLGQRREDGLLWPKRLIACSPPCLPLEGGGTPKA